MNAAPIVRATLAFDDRGVPFSAAYGDVYQPEAGALVQARHVFLGGCALPQRWQGRERFVVLETGFGLGNNFLATWRAWRDDPHRCEQLVFISIEQHPFTHDDLATVYAESPLAEEAHALLNAWPPLTHNLHRLVFDDSRVVLLLALGDVQAWLPELVATVDAFYLDGFAPAANPRMWDARVCKALGRLAAPDATLATWSAARALRDNLGSAGFEVRLGAGVGGKRDITLARFAPRFTPRRAPSRPVGKSSSDKRALVIGAGLAGCAAAWALAEQGWHTQLVERAPHIASAASGNPAGLFHGIVNAHDGVHARFNRSAALAARDAVQIALDAHGARGSTRGLLRLESASDIAAMRATLLRLGLPANYLQAVDAAEASALAGIALSHAAWVYPSCGWVEPAALARSFLARAGGRVERCFGIDVQGLKRTDAGWQLLDADDREIATAPTVVLANAGDALRLLGEPGWPIASVRGQISMLDAGTAPLTSPQLPIAGAGYLLPAVNGELIFGATSQAGDGDPSVRDADHVFNLAQLARLTGRALAIDPLECRGRTAWRFSSGDRLPVIGAVPDVAPNAIRLDQPRFVPRLPGLFVFTALGSRGITWSALGAQILASWVTGAPSPVEASLLDAVDPARFVSRQARRIAQR